MDDLIINLILTYFLAKPNMLIPGLEIGLVGSRGIYKICQNLDPIVSVRLSFGSTNKSRVKLVIVKKLNDI